MMLTQSPSAEHILRQLWPDAAGLTQMLFPHKTVTLWIECQGQLDHKGNHFMGAFRGKHGVRQIACDDESPVRL
ncbi:MAG: hypothetical protein GY930_12220 [bacterium]|nr:hypothetical protein [bacterium]